MILLDFTHAPTANTAYVQCKHWCPVNICPHRSLYVNMVGLWVTVSLAMLSGLTMYSIYKDCDPFTNKDVGASDQVIQALAVTSSFLLTMLTINLTK